MREREKGTLDMLRRVWFSPRRVGVESCMYMRSRTSTPRYAAIFGNGSQHNGNRKSEGVKVKCVLNADSARERGKRERARKKKRESERELAAGLLGWLFSSLIILRYAEKLESAENCDFKFSKSATVGGST